MSDPRQTATLLVVAILLAHLFHSGRLQQIWAAIWQNGGSVGVALGQGVSGSFTPTGAAGSAIGAGVGGVTIEPVTGGTTGGSSSGSGGQTSSSTPARTSAPGRGLVNS